jgi:hypothetical protein
MAETRTPDAKLVSWWSGDWCKFSDYEVREGVIVPARHATPEEYDPWDLYLRSHTQKNTPKPYESLLALVTELNVTWNEGVARWTFEDELNQEGNELILQWCRLFGLLGILPHCAIRITLPIRSLRLHPGARVRPCYIRRNGRWAMVPVEPDAALLVTDAKSLGPAVPSDAWDYVEPSVFLLQDDQGLAPYSREVLLERILVDYFPDFDRGKGADFPPPLTERFWCAYGEPKDLFLNWALDFYNALYPGPEMRPPDLFDLELLAEPAGVALEMSPTGRIIERWKCPSLLSSFGRMAVQDLLTGTQIRRCECGKPFAADHYQSLYCSPKCAGRIRKRRVRANRTAVER